MPRLNKTSRGKASSLATLVAEGDDERGPAQGRRSAASQYRSTAVGKNSTSSQLGNNKVRVEVEKKHSYSSDSEASHQDTEIIKMGRRGKEEGEELADSGCATSSKDSLSLGRRSSVSSSEERQCVSSEEREPPTILKKLSKSYEHLDRERKISRPSDIVGFGLLPNQVYRKAVKKGFEFSLMVVGESGLGKSTLVNSMFLTDIYSNDGEKEEEADQTLQVETHECMLEENGVRLALTVVDTPGYGDAVDNTGCWAPILAYIEQQFDAYLEGETRVQRVEVPDTLVHACLYFIAPTGHGLKPLDIDFMRRIHNKVNIIPVIGKADSCTPAEIEKFKTKILIQLEQHQIQIYSFPESELEPESQWMRNRLPFAVVGSNTVVTGGDGAKYRGREYPWGTVNIEDSKHCDFMALRNLVLAHHMQDLKEVTHSRHYENFRCTKLQQMMSNIPSEDELASERGAVVEETLVVRNHSQATDESGSELGEDFSRLSRRLEHLHSYAATEEWGESRDEIGSVGGGRRRNSFLGQNKLWEKYQSASMNDLKPKTLDAMFKGRKLKGLVTAINSRVRQ